MYQFKNTTFDNAAMVADNSNLPKIILMKNKEEICCINNNCEWRHIIQTLYPKIIISIYDPINNPFTDKAQRIKLNYKGSELILDNHFDITAISKKNLDAVCCKIESFILSAESINYSLINNFNKE